MNILTFAPGHRADLTTLSSREAFRSKSNSSGLSVGDQGHFGRILVRGEKGHDTVPQLYPLSGEPVVDKPGQSAFMHTDFDLLLRIRGIKNLIVAGLTTDSSVSSTIRDASERGLDCLLVRDGTVASQALLQNAACETIETEGGVFGATASLQDVLIMMKTLASVEKGSEMSGKNMEARTVPASTEKSQSPNNVSTQPQDMPSQQPVATLTKSGKIEADTISSSQASGQPTGDPNAQSDAPPKDQSNASNVTSLPTPYTPGEAPAGQLAERPPASTAQQNEMSFAPTSTTNEQIPASSVNSNAQTASSTDQMPATKTKSEPNSSENSAIIPAGAVADTTAASSESIDKGDVSLVPAKGRDSDQLVEKGAAAAIPANPADNPPGEATTAGMPANSADKASGQATTGASLTDPIMKPPLAETPVAAPSDGLVSLPPANSAQSADETINLMVPAGTTESSGAAGISASAPTDEPTGPTLSNSNTPAGELGSSVPSTESTNVMVKDKASTTSQDERPGIAPPQGASSRDLGDEGSVQNRTKEISTGIPNEGALAPPSDKDGTATTATEPSTVTMPGAETTSSPATGTGSFMSPTAAFAPQPATESKAADVTGVNAAKEIDSNPTTTMQAPQSSVDKPVTTSSAYPSTFASSACTTCT